MAPLFNLASLSFLIFLASSFNFSTRLTKYSRVFECGMFVTCIAGTAWLVAYAFKTEWFYPFALLFMGLIVSGLIRTIIVRVIYFTYGQPPKPTFGHDDLCDLNPHISLLVERRVAYISLPIFFIAGVAMFITLFQSL